MLQAIYILHAWEIFACAQYLIISRQVELQAKQFVLDLFYYQNDAFIAKVVLYNNNLVNNFSQASQLFKSFYVYEGR